MGRANRPHRFEARIAGVSVDLRHRWSAVVDALALTGECEGRASGGTESRSAGVAGRAGRLFALARAAIAGESDEGRIVDLASVSGVIRRYSADVSRELGTRSRTAP